jgi:uncharacterized protein
MAAMTKLFPLLLLVFAHSINGHAAPLICKAKLLSPVETMICSDEKLSDYEGRISIYFHKAIVVSNPQEQRQILDEQRLWLTDIRNRCDSWHCLHGAYQARLGALTKTYYERWDATISDGVLIELSRRSATPAKELKELLSNCTQSQMNMNYCSFRTFVEADLAMRSALARKLETLPLSCHAELQASQAKWEKVRSSQCNQNADEEAENGSVRPMIFNACQAETTEQHIAQLKSIKSCDSILTSMQ